MTKKNNKKTPSKHESVKKLDKKKRYWTNWQEILNQNSESEEEFWLRFKKEFSKNYNMYKIWSNVKLYTTLSTLATESGVQHKHTVLKFIRKFVNEFMHVDSLVGGIELVDAIIDSIRKGDIPNAVQLTTNLVHPKKPKGGTSITPVKLVEGFKHLEINKTSALYDMHIEWTVHEIWELLFDEVETKKRKKDLDRWINKKVQRTDIQKDIVKRFKHEWKTIKNIVDRFSDDYTGIILHNNEKHALSLHQKVIAYYTSINDGFIDLGDTGVGKTWSGLSAVALLHSRVNLIVVPANIIDQWVTNIRNTFKNPTVYTQNDILRKGFQLRIKNNERVFYVVSYQLISTSKGNSILRKVREAGLDFIILDEGQRIKIRDPLKLSKCRAKLQNNVGKARKNKKIKILMLTATPAPNTVTEVKSLTEITTGKALRISNFNSLTNLAKMHAQLATHSLRNNKIYRNGKRKIQVKEDTIECYADYNLEEHKRHLLDVGFLGMDQIAMEAKIPYIIKQLKKERKKNKKVKVIIFTKYVTEILPMLRRALRSNNISYTQYTGSDKSGLDPRLGAKFFNGKQVLLASSAVAEGLDKIQDYCHKIWFAGHGWTYTEKQQVLGRVYRNGQKNNVDCLTFVAIVNGLKYDELVKINRINYKKIIHDTIIRGKFVKTATLAEYKIKDFLEKIVNAKTKNVKKFISSELGDSIGRQARRARKRKAQRKARKKDGKKKK